MDKVICLYFEDDDIQRKRYTGKIERAWESLHSRAGLEVQPVGTIPEAEEKIKQAQNGGLLHLFVVDLKVKEDSREENSGVGLIDFARKCIPDLGIIALSVGGGDLFERAKNAGADDTVSKAYLAEGHDEDLGKKMLKALTDHGHEPSEQNEDIVTTDGIDLRLEALIHIIGKKNIANLITRLGKNKTYDEIRPFYIRSGLSGASVLRVDAKYSNQDPQIKRDETKRILLKISKDREALLSEFKNFEELVSEFPNGAFVPIIRYSPAPVNSGAWHAISYEYVDEAKTLVDWLTAASQSNEDDVRNLMRGLFLDEDRGLYKVYQNLTLANDERPNTSFWKLLTPSRKARILETVEEEKFESLAVKYLSDRFDSNIIKSFLSDNRISNLDENRVKKGSYSCLSHGDFHGRNVLVSKANRSYLIDPANIEDSPWAYDIARLSVDLIVSGWDSGQLSYEWENIQNWAELVFRFIADDLENYHLEGNDNLKVFAALSWIRSHLKEIFPIAEERRWEFSLALAVELLRSAYRQDLPAPKRVLGLACACDALREAAKNYEFH